MNRMRALMVAIAVALVMAVSPSGFAGDAGKAFFAPKAELTWTPAGIPGVSTAVVEGDLAKGASRFYLKYPAGLVTPLHHHSPDHFVTTISGNLVLVADGKEHRLPAGSYFSFLGKASHAARCEGNEACVMFVNAAGAWDVVPEK